jgi:hypothetical protein
LFLSLRKYDPGCPSGPDPDLDFLPIPDSGVKKAPDPGSATLVVKMRLQILIRILKFRKIPYYCCDVTFIIEFV